MQPTKTYSRKEVAAKLGINKQTIYRWEKDKKVPAPSRLVRRNMCIYTDDDIEVLEKYRDAVSHG